MYTVIVADDEEEIRKGIIQKVDWEKIGFRLIGEAENGVDALEVVEKLEPDLLLTDIRMPFLSGIELARQVREVRPATQIVFLSGFDEFSYAQQAIQYNIISYLLKPISSKELETELSKIKEIIDKKFREFNSTALVREQLEKSEFLLPLLLDGFQEDITGSKNEEFMKNAINCGLLRSKNTEVLHFAVIVTKIMDQSGENRTNRSSVNAVDMILKKYVKYASCYLNGRVVSILAATRTALGKYLHILVNEIVQSVGRIMHLECGVGVSRSIDNLENCRECYLEAMNAISYSGESEEKVHFIADEERIDDFDQEMVQSAISNVEGLLRGGSFEELEQYLKKFELSICSGRISPVIANFLMMQVVTDIYRVVYTVAGDEAIQELQKYFPFKNLTLSEQMTKMVNSYNQLCREAKKLIYEQRKKSSEVLCDKAIEIIYTRYQEQDLSLVSVSEEIAVSPNYLSALIKKSTGSTFIEILTRKRMEKAKELLLCTSMKIREITEACGYRDQHYFSYCFKKETGFSPISCRRSNER